jgi:tetratricopeptide (TPR) repeat protein
MIELLRTPDALVCATGLENAADTVFISFTQWQPQPGLHSAPWGHAFFKARKWPTIYIIPSRNDWYQSPADQAAIAVAVEASRSFRRVVTYGSSMGGFAALSFAGRFEASAALSIIPQYSIARDAVPFEKRWATEARKIAHFPPEPLADFPAECKAFVLYDPYFREDRLHADRIRDAIPATMIPCPLMGHSGPGSAALKVALELIWQGKETEVATSVRQSFRATRRGSSNYYMQLARLGRHLPDSSRILLLLQAKTYNDQDEKIDLTLSEILMRNGRLREANYVERQAVKQFPRNALLWSRLAASSIRLKDYDTATNALSRALEIAPRNGYYHHQRAGLLLTTGQLEEAVESQKVALELDSGNPGYLAQMARILSRLETQNARKNLPT